ncbi:substrate-binding periplasmic protein [Rhodoferax sp.]|uniref:substrate-binding periplasmic protein n=1 Tax=Rhodoferax sp. TaxID=50421 RepID=UPI002756DCB1|nr:ABC transporter substrate-binding protein [Rhodoferax sp.]
MHKKSRWIQTALALLAGLFSTVLQATTLRLTTEVSPPFNMLEGDKIVGRSTDQVREMMDRAKVNFTMEVLPWARAYNMALKEPDTCVFTTTRTPEREALFKWVGPVGAAEWVLYGSAERKLKLQNIEEARSLLIGTYLGDARDEYFRSRGFRVESVSDDLANPRKLLLNRIDLWAASVVRGALLISQNGWTDQIVPVLSFHKVDLYVACNPAVPTALIDKLNATLEGMVRDGTSKAMEKKYARWPLPPN